MKTKTKKLKKSKKLIKLQTARLNETNIPRETTSHRSCGEYLSTCGRGGRGC